MRRLAILLGIAILAFGAVACSSDDGGSDSGGSSSGGGSSASGGGSSASVALGRFVFNPDSITVSAGEVTIDITNEDGSPHNFVVEDLDVESDTLDPDGSTSVTFTATAGSYEIICSISGHKEAGMVGTLTVT